MHVFPLPHTHKSSTREKGEKKSEKICLSILLYNCLCLSAQYYCPSVHLSFCYCSTSKTHLLFHLFYRFVQSVFFFYPLSFKVFFVYLPISSLSIPLSNLSLLFAIIWFTVITFHYRIVDLPINR